MLEHQPPAEYVSPVPTYAHKDHQGFENEWEDYHIDDYFGSDGSDHSHYRYDNWDDPELHAHNHSQLNPYAKEWAYQPSAEEYWVPVVLDNPPVAYVEHDHPELTHFDDELDDLSITPMDLEYWLTYNESTYDIPVYEENAYFPAPDVEVVEYGDPAPDTADIDAMVADLLA